MKIHIGSVNDDFIHDRISAIVFIGDKRYFLKIYADGRITSFFEDRFDGAIEKELSDEFRKELYACESIEFYFMNKPCREMVSFETFMDSYKEIFK